jgi:glycosyltransferase involved in cell wall biosynthesis
MNVQIHNDFFDNPYWIELRGLNRLFNKLGKFILKYADTIRVGTEYEKQKIVRMGIDAEKVRVIPVYADVVRFSKNYNGSGRSQFMQQHGLERCKALVVSTGRLEPQKDFPSLIQAMVRVCEVYPDTCLCILGEGSDRKRIMDEVKKHGLASNVILPGAVSHEEVAGYLNACDVYVMPSIFEGTCIAVAEASLSGKPVVATAFAGAHELVVDGKTGFRVPIRDIEAISGKIIHLLAHPKEAREMGRAARAHVMSMFNKEHNIRGVVRMWEETARLVSEV